jgi:hypothetical protein
MFGICSSKFGLKKETKEIFVRGIITGVITTSEQTGVPRTLQLKEQRNIPYKRSCSVLETCVNAD